MLLKNVSTQQAVRFSDRQTDLNMEFVKQLGMLKIILVIAKVTYLQGRPALENKNS